MSKSSSSPVVAALIGAMFSIGARAETVFANHTLGVVTVGLSESNREMRRAVSLVVSGDDPSSQIAAEQSALCARLALPETTDDSASPGRRLIEQLDRLEVQFNPTPQEMRQEVSRELNLGAALAEQGDTSDIRAYVAAQLENVTMSIAHASPSTESEIKAATQEAIRATHAEFVGAMISVNKRLFDCNNNLTLRVGIALYACSIEDPACESPEVADASSMEARRYTRVTEWLRAVLGKKEPLPTYAVLKLMPSSKDPSRVAVEQAVESFLGVVDTSGALDSAELQRQFERLASFTRAKATGVANAQRYRIPFAAVEAAGLSLEVAIRLSDTIADPQRIAVLPSVPSGALLVLEDEVARARIQECYYYRGQQSAQQIAKCVPYKLADNEVMDCLAGRSCNPQFLAKGKASLNALLITTPKKFDELLSQDLPRLRAFKLDDGLTQFFADCEQAGLAGDKLTGCALSKALPAELAAETLTDCVRSAATVSQAIDRLDCIPGLSERISPQTKRALETAKCLEANRSTMVDCLAAGSATAAQANALIACTEKTTTVEQTACVTNALGANAKAAQAVECVNDANGDTTKIAVCAGQAILSEDAAKAIACVKDQPDSTAVATCLASDKLPESIRKPVQCAASSGGNPMGAAVCMTGDGLTEDQRIALQCAAQSGGEPNTFLVCTGGQMLFSTVAACSKAKFGESPCFGPGNELQKLVVALGLPPAGPNSVVGDIINANLDAVRYTVAAAESVGEEAERFARNAERELKRFERETKRAAQDVTRVLFEKPAQTVGGVISGLGKLGKKLL